MMFSLADTLLGDLSQFCPSTSNTLGANSPARNYKRRITTLQVPFVIARVNVLGNLQR